MRVTIECFVVYQCEKSTSPQPHLTEGRVFHEDTWNKHNDLKTQMMRSINFLLKQSSMYPKPGVALPYVGGYQVPVNRPPFFTSILHPTTPFFYSVHTQWPPFFHFCIKFYVNIANFCALRAHFEKFNDFMAILRENLQILPWNCIFAHWMTPIFGSPHQKSPHFFGAHTEWPFFRWNLTLNAPYFRSPVGTCTSLSYLSAPGTLRCSLTLSYLG